MEKKPLWTKSFIFAFTANLLMFFSFYLLVPILPFYVTEQLRASESVAGIVLSLYTLAALTIRPFSGYMVDTFARKPLYLIVYSVFTAVFAGYLVAGTLALFIIMRIIHGAAFGVNTVSGSTLALDIMPSERRGEGIGYFGMTASIAMAIGPMTGLFLYNSYSFDVIFMVSFVSSLLGLMFIIFIKAPSKVLPKSKEVISLDRFILVRGLPISFVFFCIAIGYGVITNYIGLYSKQIGMGGAAGLFFTLEAVGIIAARLLSARSINRGELIQSVYIGIACLIVGYVLCIFFENRASFYISAFILGVGFGYITPAIQNIFINLAPHNRRGTANSTFYTSWDLGIGLGIGFGGYMIENYSFSILYALCLVAVTLGTIFFRLKVVSHFKKYRLQ